jgi:transposase
MPASSIKLRLYLSQKQAFVFGNWNYSDQMFRNHSVEYLRLRYFDRRAWLAKNHQSQAYLTWKQDIKAASEKMKTFNSSYPSKEAKKEATTLGLKPVYPDVLHPVLENDIASLSVHLTAELEKSKTWLMKNLTHASAQYADVPMLKVLPKSVSKFVNALPLALRKSLQKIARNEGILLYLLQAPRTVFDQTINDLQKTYAKAYSNLKSGLPASQAGFPRFARITRHGGVRAQISAKNEQVASAWHNQELYIPGIGALDWRDSGYVLPVEIAKMITIKKNPSGHIHATFAGVPAYKAGKSPIAQTIMPPANSAAQFLDEYTEAFDINRQSGLPVLVGSHDRLDEHGNATHTVSVLDQKQLARMQVKIKRREKYIAFQQAQLASKRLAGSRNRKRNKKNPNSAHRKGKISHRYQKTQDKINQTFEGLNNLKEFYLRALAQKMIKGKSLLIIEDLDVKGMQEAERPANRTARHHKNDKHSQHDSCFGKFIRILEETCIKQNVILIKCGQYDPTSQLCHKCGFRWGKLDTSIRKVTCTGCGQTHDRDHNATMNVKFLALYRYIKGEQSLNNVKHLSSDIFEGYSKNFDIPSAESVDGGQVITRLTQISHGDVLTYIKDRYPIDLVLTSLGEYPRTCGTQDHAVSDWFKPKRKAASRSRKSQEALTALDLPRSLLASSV